MTVSHETLIELATAAAPYLDGQWRFNRLQTNERSSGWLKMAVITDTAQVGRSLELREDMMQSGRVAISGDLLKLTGRLYRSEQKITVSPTRTGRAIAGDINRRLLPVYLNEWKERVALNERQSQSNDEFLQKLHLIQSFLPTLSAENGRNLVNSDRFCFRCADNVNGQITMYKAHPRIRIEVSLEFDKLLKLAAAIKEL